MDYMIVDCKFQISIQLTVSVASRHNTWDRTIQTGGMCVHLMPLEFVHRVTNKKDLSFACSRLDLTGGRGENRRIGTTADIDGLEGGERGSLVLSQKRLFTRRQRFAETFQRRQNLGRLERVLSVRDFAELVIAFKSSEAFTKLTTFVFICCVRIR